MIYLGLGVLLLVLAVWLLRAVAGSPDQMQIMYGVAGERRLTEFELPDLPAEPSGVSYVKRDPIALILGVNATEADVAETEYREKRAVLK